MLFWILFVIAYIPMLLMFPTKVFNRKKMPKSKCIVTSNHYSNADAPVYVIQFRRKFSMLAKKELFKNKFLTFFFKCIGAIEVDRENVGIGVFKTVLKELGKNKQVFIFPEGTRNKEGSDQMLELKTGIISFASKGEVEIVPMLMHHKPRLFRKNYIIVGDPLKIVGENPKRLTKEEVQLNVENYTNAMAALRIELEEKLTKKKKKK